MCRVDDYDPPQFSSSDWRRARKEHKCEECYGPIRPRETYKRVAGKYDGMMYTYALCESCDAWGEAYSKAQRQHCSGRGWSWELGRMWEDIAEFVEEHLGYDPATGEERPIYHEPAPPRDIASPFGAND